MVSDLAFRLGSSFAPHIAAPDLHPARSNTRSPITDSGFTCASPQGAAIGADELADYPPVFRDTGSSRVARVQDILLFLQSPQMEVDRYRVRVA